jgi:hypothetical protein
MLFGLAARNSLTASLMCFKSKGDSVALLCSLSSWSDVVLDPPYEPAQQ